MKKMLILTAVVLLLLALVPVLASAQEGVECAEEVTVQKDDWLSKYADKYFGNVLSWPAIMAWNNQAAEAEPDKYDSIDNPDLIVVGWSICIPSAEDAEAFLATYDPSKPELLYPGREVPVEAAADPMRPLNLYMVQHALCAWDSWWCTLKGAVEQAEKDMNVSVTVLGPDQFDLEQTAALIDQAVAANPDGLAVTVTDPVLFKEPIMRAIEAGIPVVAFNAGSGPEADGIPYMTYLGMDEYQGGYQGGKRLAAAGASKAVCINHQVGHTGLDARCQGLVDAMAEAGGSAEVLAISNDPAESQTIIDDYYTANPDTDTFLTLGPNGANPFYAFMESAGLGAGDILHGTFDYSPEIEQKILDGTTMFGIDQQPYLQGYGAVGLLAQNARLGLTPALPITPTGPGFIDQTNAGAEQHPDKEVNIYMVQHALCAWDSWWCTLKNAVEQAEKDMNVSVTVLGPDQFDLEQTAALIDQAVAANPDGLAVTVTDPVLFKEPIMRAIEAGIPVVAFNAGSGPEADGIPYMTYVGMDEYQGGLQGGKRLADAGGTKAVCINHQVGHTGLDARCQGLVDAFTEKGMEAEVLAISNDPAESQTIIDDYYTANPDTDTFLTLGPNGANPFYAFMESAGLGAGDIQHGTFDLSPEIVAKIKDGTTMFGVDQQPYLQGYGSVQILTLLNRYNLTPALPVTPTGPGFVDQSNIGVVEALAGEYR